MNRQSLLSLLEAVQAGEVSPGEALERLMTWPVEMLGDAVRVDHHRLARQGFPEFVYAEGKPPDLVAEIVARLVDRQHVALATRVSPEAAAMTRARVPDAVYDAESRVLSVGGPLVLADVPSLDVAVVAAGTSDRPVAEEAAQVAAFLNHRVQRLYDVGVAGLHRLLDHLADLRAADAVIVVAGMEGALPSVVGGLVGVPVVAVPTSVGYGAHFGGVTPLLAMLNSCAAGVVVVNIDSGFGAALAVHRMAVARGQGRGRQTSHQ